MQVSEVMHKGVNTVQIHDSIKKVAALMKREDIGAVPVYKNERPVGFVTDRDIVVSCVASGHPVDDPISHAMTREIFSIHEGDDLNMATQLMRENQISRLLVVNESEQPVGMITIQDITKFSSDINLTNEVLTDIKR
ncbi:MAG: CBS domain-containing protein [Bacteriovoracaceae bacterium]|nr:CBS domain-containing protein [Bacteriovoracaceae bacterium]